MIIQNRVDPGLPGLIAGQVAEDNGSEMSYFVTLIRYPSDRCIVTWVDYFYL